MNSHGRNISVVGLGYVGLPVAVAFGKSQQVIGFDISSIRIEEALLNKSKFGRSYPFLTVVRFLRT